MQARFTLAVLLGVVLIAAAACSGGGDDERIAELETDLEASEEARGEAEDGGVEAERSEQARKRARKRPRPRLSRPRRPPKAERSAKTPNRRRKKPRRRQEAEAARQAAEAERQRLAAAAEERRKADAAERARTAISGHDQPLLIPGTLGRRNRTRRARARNQSAGPVHDIDGQIGPLVDDLAHRPRRADAGHDPNLLRCGGADERVPSGPVRSTREDVGPRVTTDAVIDGTGDGRRVGQHHER